MGEKKFLRIRDVLAKTGMGRTYIYERMAAGEFPQAIKPGGRTTVWWEHEIEAWMEAKAALRENPVT